VALLKTVDDMKKRGNFDMDELAEMGIDIKPKEGELSTQEQDPGHLNQDSSLARTSPDALRNQSARQAS